MREIAEIDLAIQGGTEKIEKLGADTCVSVNSRLSVVFAAGEDGKVEDSMREVAAIEALKAEKAGREV